VSPVQPRGNRIIGYLILAALLIAGLGWLGLSMVKSVSAPPTMKIGLIAPFEGLYRSTGYEVLFAVKIALQERNQGAGLNGYRVELVALNDFNDPDEAYRQAQALVTDPDVVGVIGHLEAASTAAALPVYREAQLATVIPWSVDASSLTGDWPGVVSVAATTDRAASVLETISRESGDEPREITSALDLATPPRPDQPLVLDTDAVSAGSIVLSLREAKLMPPLFGQVDVGNRQLLQVAGPAADGLIIVSPGPAVEDVSGSENLNSTYQALAGHPPGPRALLAYDAANVLLDSVEKAMIIRDQQWFNEHSVRADVGAVLASVQRHGVTGEIAFDGEGRRQAAPIWVYEISDAKYPGILVAP
jgi:branched-chain amino acid transport system substrate-binding protein